MSHVLIGLIAATRIQGPGELRPSSAVLVGVASIAPDLCFFPLGLKLGRDQGRPFWLPRWADWVGCRQRHPRWVALSWDLPYSVFTLAAVTGLGLGLGLAGAGWWRAGAACCAAYVLHVLVDYVTHTGEWRNRPLYPLSDWECPSLTNSWDWPARYNLVAWAVLGALLYLSARAW